MANTIISLPADNKAASGIITLDTGTANASYPLANLSDLIVAKPFKTTTTGAVVVKWDYTSAQRLDVVALPMHNIPFGITVNFQGNATDAWGAPTLNAVLTMPGFNSDGMPVGGAWVDLTAVAGYSVSGFRFWRLSIATPSQVTALGEIWLGTTKRQIRNFTKGTVRPRRRVAITRVTELGVPLPYDLGVTLRGITATIFNVGAAYTDLVTLYDAVKGPVNPFLLIPDSSVNDALIGRLVSAFDPTTLGPGTTRVTMQFNEDSRGLAL